jgi:hypothetical protein
MGNCPTTPSESAAKSLDPLCNGERMWTTFLFSSLFTLVGGWIIILLYDFLKAIVIKRRRLKLISTIKNLSRIDEVVSIIDQRSSSVLNNVYIFDFISCCSSSFPLDERAYHGQVLLDRTMKTMPIISVGYNQSKNGRIILFPVKLKWARPW